MVASTRVDGVHVVDECFHSLVYAVDGLVDGVLQRTVLAFESVERLFDEVVKFYVIQVAEVLTEDGFGVFTSSTNDERT